MSCPFLYLSKYFIRNDATLLSWCVFYFTLKPLEISSFSPLISFMLFILTLPHIFLSKGPIYLILCNVQWDWSWCLTINVYIWEKKSNWLFKLADDAIMFHSHNYNCLHYVAENTILFCPFTDVCFLMNLLRNYTFKNVAWGTKSNGIVC